MSDDLVERVALAMAFCASDGADPCEEVCGWCLHRARPVVAIVLEEAAKVCDAIESETWRLWKTHSDMLDQGRSDGAGDCAAAIRALMKQSTTEEERA